MAINPQDGSLTAGIAAKSTEDVNPPVDELVTGDLPVYGADTDETVLTGQDLDALTVVGFDNNGKVIPAEHGVTQAVGFLPYAVDTATPGTDLTARVVRTGCLNPEVLVWDASYDTDAKKHKAFEGAPAPTQIVIRKIATMAV